MSFKEERKTLNALRIQINLSIKPLIDGFPLKKKAFKFVFKY